MTDNTKPAADSLPSDADVDAFVANLSETDKEELRRQRLLNAALSRKTEKAPDLGRMNFVEFEKYKRDLGM